MTKESSVNRMSDSGIYLLMQDITDASCKETISFILEKNLDLTETRLKEIQLIINSPGGSVSAAFSLIDIMIGSNIPVITIGIGQVASAGLLIFMSGRNRTLTPNTSILSHQYQWGSFGKQHDLIAVRKEQDLITERIFNHYKMCTKMSDKQIMKLLGPSDMWMSAVEAKKYGFCDNIKQFNLAHNNG